MYENPIYMIKKNKKGSFLYGDKRGKMKMTVVEEQINQEDLKAEESEEDEKVNSKENKEDKNYSVKNNKNKNSSIGTSNKDDDKVMNFSFGRKRIDSKKRTETFSQDNDNDGNSASKSKNDQSKNRDKFSKTYESPSKSNEKSDNRIESDYSTPNGEMEEIDEENNESSKNQGTVKQKKYSDSEDSDEEDNEEENDNYNNNEDNYNDNNLDKDMNTVSEVEENEFYDGREKYMSKNYGNYDYGDYSATISEKESMEDFPNMMNIFKEDPNKEEKEKEEQKRILEITEAFNLFDKDCDGNIDIRELATVMRTLGYNPNKDELDDIIKTFDEDESGTIDKDEFINLLTTKLKEQKEDKDLLEIFNMFDKNRDGFISEEDINYIIDEVGDDLDEEIITELIKKGDDDNDSRINFIEFKKIFIGKKNK